MTVTADSLAELREPVRRLVTAQGGPARLRDGSTGPGATSPAVGSPGTTGPGTTGPGATGPEGADGPGTDFWQRLTGELGATAILIPERHEGQGLGFREQGLVLEELGAGLAGGPYLGGAVFPAIALLSAGDEAAAARWLPQIAAGELLAAVAISEDSPAWHPAGLTTTATAVDSQYYIFGRKRVVLGDAATGLYLVSARAEDGPGLFAVASRAPGVTLTPEPVLDLTRPLTAIGFESAPATRLSPRRPAGQVLAEIADLACVALACEQVGAARGALGITTEYARTRIQFGREIGSFQAVRHRLADLYGLVTCAEAAAREAARVAAGGSGELPVAAAVAKSYCSEALSAVARQMVQLHGGIGFTWEHPAHLYFKRAKSSSLLLGEPAAHRARLHELLHG